MVRSMKSVRSMSQAAVSRTSADPIMPVLPSILNAPDVSKPKVPSGPSQQEGKLCGVWTKSTDINIARAKGSTVWGMDGRRYLDMTAGIAVCNTGHCHPRIVQAIQQQAELVIHAQLNNYHHPGADELARRLGGYMPQGLDTIYYDNTGSQAIEAAVKLARLHTKRPNILTLHGGMHGRSTMCSAMTSNHSIRNPLYTPLPSGVYVAPFPASYRWDVSENEAVARALNGVRDVLKGQVRADQVAALVMEPVLGEGGFYEVPRDFVRGLRALLEPHGILLISDEIQAGFGRTGYMFGCELYSDVWRPDIIACSKGIASGLPLSVVASTEDIMTAFAPGEHGGTFNGNAVAIASALATLDVFEEEGLIENSRRVGGLLTDMLAMICTEHMPHGQVRGPGMMIAIECRDSLNNPDAACARFVKDHCRVHNNVLIYAPTGFEGNILRIMPPLVLEEHEAVRAANAVEEAFRAWTARCPPLTFD